MVLVSFKRCYPDTVWGIQRSWSVQTQNVALPMHNSAFNRAPCYIFISAGAKLFWGKDLQETRFPGERPELFDLLVISTYQVFYLFIFPLEYVGGRITGYFIIAVILLHANKQQRYDILLMV